MAVLGSVGRRADREKGARMTLSVIVPSRGRPQNCQRLAEAFDATCTLDDTTLLIAVDPDDPTLDDYLTGGYGTHGSLTILPERMRLGPTLNYLAAGIAVINTAVGFMGDDHLPRTHGWDAQVTGELDRLGMGLVYGDDLLQGELLPTAVFMTSSIIRTVGWMCPPGLTHLFLDDAWLTLGRALNAITYLPDMVIEHCHPVAGKAEDDAGYAECNAPDVWAHDEAVFARWRDEQLAVDVDKLTAAQ